MNGIRSAHGLVGGDLAIFRGPARGWGGEGVPALFSVGYDGLVTDVYTGETKTMFQKASDLVPVLSLGAGGTGTFGNDTAIAAVETSVTALRSRWGYGPSDPVMLIGLSMGFCDLMAWAREHPTEVVGAIGCVGLTDLTEQWTSNRDLGGGVMGTSVINSAYGGAYSPSTHGPTHSPIEFAESLGFPISYFYSTDDPLIPLSSANAFVALSNVTGYSLGAVGHGSTAIAATHQHAAFLPAIEALAA